MGAKIRPAIGLPCGRASERDGNDPRTENRLRLAVDEGKEHARNQSNEMADEPVEEATATRTGGQIVIEIELTTSIERSSLGT